MAHIYSHVSHLPLERLVTICSSVYLVVLQTYLSVKVKNFVVLWIIHLFFFNYESWRDGVFVAFCILSGSELRNLS